MRSKFIPIVLFLGFTLNGFCQNGLKSVDLINTKNTKFGQLKQLQDAALKGTMLGATTSNGSLVLKQGFILCSVRNASKGLPQRIVLPTKLVNAGSKIDFQKLKAAIGHRGFRLNPGTIAVVGCAASCSDPDGDPCRLEQSERKGKVVSYCTGCCDVVSSKGIAIAIPSFSTTD